jgi:hypothetical protein
VKYRPNDLDDRGRPFFGLTAYPVSGVETGRYIGGATIIDDDPTPGVELGTGARRVRAGHQATWIMTLDKPVHYFAFAIARPVRAVDGPQLRVGDLPRRFRERALDGKVALDTPLYRTRIRFFVQIRQGRTSGQLSIPTRPRHGVTRALSLQFRAPGFDLTHPVRTVRVLPSR